MTLIEQLYRLVMPAAPALAPLVRGEGKLAQGFAGRRGVVERMRAWAAEHRRVDRQLAWFHAPSVGEGLQARAVIHELRRRHGHALHVAYTFFSPSAAPFAPSVSADFADYLPFDAPGQIRVALDALRPDALVFTKNEVWPVMTREAEQRQIPMALLSATLPATSGRLSRPGRALMAPSYRRLARIAAIAAEDAERHRVFGVPGERLSVMGDARFDQVAERAAAVDRDGPLLTLLRSDKLTVVAGSTWSEDEERLLPALASVRDGDGTRLILVPHEPTPAHLTAAGERCAAEGLAVARLSTFRPASHGLADVLLVDRVGVLGDLYALADIAYVGGGFGRAGLHSVLEPAAFGVPVLFGPHHENAREAGELIKAGGGIEVEGGEALTRTLRRLIQDLEARRSAGEAARAYVEAGRGAAARGADLVEVLLRSGPVSPG